MLQKRTRYAVLCHGAQILLLSALCLCIVGSLVVFNKRALYNSDTLSAFMIVSDFLLDPSSLHAWYQPPSLYIFPDTLLVALVQLFSVSVYWQPIVYASLMLFLDCVAAGALCRTVCGFRLWPAVWLCAAVLFGFMAITSLWFGRTPSAHYYLSILTPDMHSGCLLLSLVAATLNARTIQSNFTSKARLWLPIVSFLATLSDSLFIVWFVGPAVVILWLNCQKTARRAARWHAAVLAGSALAGLALSLKLNGATALRYQTDISVTPWRSLIEVLALFGSWVERLNVPALAILGMSTMHVGRATQLLFRLYQQQTLSNRQTQELFMGMVVLASCLAPILTGRFSDVGHWRYLSPLFIFPLLWPLCAIRSDLANKKRGPIVALAIVALATGVDAKRGLEQATQPRALQSCLESSGRTVGLADYWLAKPLRFLSGQRLKMIPVATHGVPFRWIMNERWITEAVVQQPDFIVMTNLDPKSLLARFGAPDEVKLCAGHEIWLYSRRLAVR